LHHNPGASAPDLLAPIPLDPPSIQEQKLIQLVLHGVSSAHTRRAYRTGLVEFFAWMKQAHSRPAFTKALVQEYRAHLEDRLVPAPRAGEGRRLSAATINLRMATVKKLALEMADNGLLEQSAAAAIGRAKGAKQRGAKAGNWLGRGEAIELLRAPDGESLKGLRDRAILAVLLNCGLRRAELLRLKCSDLQQRDGRWVFLDLMGKGNRLRTVPVPANVKVALDRWTTAAGVVDGYLFRPVNKAGVASASGIQDEKVIWRLVMEYAQQIGLERLAPHDLRRTCAKLCRKNGGELEQIAFLLGHSSIQTTERYLGSEQELASAVNDGMGLDVE
jgi:integrase/recombinase XerD